MKDINSAISWFASRQGGVTYSMAQRNGPASYDCSSSVYYALIQGGYLPQGTWIGNTDSLFRDLEKHGWSKVPQNAQGNFDTQRGDVFIWGVRGASTGGAGHTGMFINQNDIIHCAYGYNGIHTDNYDWLRAINGYPEQTFYRYTGVTAPSPLNLVDQNLDIGSFVKFPGTYAVDDVQLIDGVWQVRTLAFCLHDFTWSDNGIPADPLVEVNADGFATVDQNLDIGSSYRIPGKFAVLDLGEYNGRWLAMLEWNGMKFWVDTEPLEEVSASDGGTLPIEQAASTPPAVSPTPSPEQPPTPKVDKPVTIPQIEQIKPTAPKNEQTTPINKEVPMAYTQEQQNELKIATQAAQDVLLEVAASDEAQKLVSKVSDKTKLYVYIVGDALIGLGIITPNFAIVLGWADMVRIIALSSLFSAAGAFLLTMFGIYKSGKK